MRKIINVRTGEVTEAPDLPSFPSTQPATYRVPWLTFLDRLSDANADAALVLMGTLNAKQSERLKAEGIPNAHAGVRTWLTNQGEDPDAVLAY